MKILSLIMARAGSKRLKNKNLKKINKYSLIERAIRISKKLKKIILYVIHFYPLTRIRY